MKYLKTYEENTKVDLIDKYYELQTMINKLDSIVKKYPDSFLITEIDDCRMVRLAQKLPKFKDTVAMRVLYRYHDGTQLFLHQWVDARYDRADTKPIIELLTKRYKKYIV